MPQVCSGSRGQEGSLNTWDMAQRFDHFGPVKPKQSVFAQGVKTTRIRNNSTYQTWSKNRITGWDGKNGLDHGIGVRLREIRWKIEGNLDSEMPLIRTAVDFITPALLLKIFIKQPRASWVFNSNIQRYTFKTFTGFYQESLEWCIYLDWKRWLYMLEFSQQTPQTWRSDING